MTLGRRPSHRSPDLGVLETGIEPSSRLPVRLGLALVLLVLSAALLGCASPPPPPHDGPIVLITVDTLRADVIGALGGPQGLTPHLDALAAESDWAERAVSSSSWTVPSMASLFTGLQPWRHRAWHGEQHALAEELRTLPEVMKEAGYSTLGFRSNRWLTAKTGYAQGFDEFFDLGQRKRAMARLAALDASRQFVWAHVLPPHAPYVKRQPQLDAVMNSTADGQPFELAEPETLPEKVRPLDMEPWFDPGVALDDENLRRFWTLYLVNVAWADKIVGDLLDALRESGHWDDALVIVTSDHGEEFGENDQITHGGSLHRVLIEVPLLIKLPAGSERSLEPRPGVANTRIFSTLAEAVGVPSTPEALPGLFTSDDPGALSELYLGNGDNQFSLVAGDRQVVRTVPFAPAESEYWEARLQQMGGPERAPLSEEPQQIFDRVRAAFQRTPPLAGAAEPELDGWRWMADALKPLDEDLNELDDRLEERWLETNGPDLSPEELGVEEGPELTPEELEELRALGYVVGG
jgi:hypothetical protein